MEHKKIYISLRLHQYSTHTRSLRVRELQTMTWMSRKVKVAVHCQGQERKVIEAAAIAQSQLHCPLTIHPGRGPQAPFDLLRIIQEAGGDASKTVMDHLDRM